MSYEGVLESYQCDGYVFPLRVMSEEDANAIRSHLEAVEKSRGSMHYVVKPYLMMNWIYDLATRDEILDPVKKILGPDLLLWDCEFIIKEPGSPKQVEWHQDLLYFGLDSDRLVTVWLAISPVNLKNGCMQFIAGSHAHGLVPHRETRNPDSILARGQELIEDIDLSKVVDVELRPGEMSIHHGATYHASGPNESDDRRIAICFLFISPEVKQVGRPWDSATLVAGIDRHGNFFPEIRPRMDFDPDALAFQRHADEARKALWRDVTSKISHAE